MADRVPANFKPSIISSKHSAPISIFAVSGTNSAASAESGAPTGVPPITDGAVQSLEPAAEDMIEPLDKLGPGYGHVLN